MDVPEAVKVLKSKYNVNYLDVTAGGKTIAEMIWLKLVDEVRVTLSGHFVGKQNTKDEERV